MAAFGIKAIQPQDNEHIFGFATARGTADDSLLEVWNGPTNSDLVYTLDRAGQHQSANGSAARPTYSFEADKDSGRYMSGAASMLDVVSGTAVGTWTAGKLTLVQLQVDNLNLNGNTLSSTAGTDLLITPLSGQQIVLDGTIVIDAGVVTGATSITSTNFVGTLTGTSTASLVTVVDSTDTTSSIAMFDSATGDLAAKTDAGLTYNAGTGMLTATGLTGPLTGLASTSTLASTVVVVDSTDTSSYIAMFDSATGSLAVKTDAGLTYNAGTGMLTATGLTGPLTGLASTASVATVANTVVVVDSSDTTAFPAFFDSATGSLAIKTDASNLTYNAGTGVLTAAGFAGPLTGNVTGDVAGDVTGNSDTATLASTITVAASGGDVTSHIAMFDSASGSLAAKTDPGLTYNATSNVLTAGGFVGAITGAVTGNADTATLASTVTVAASGGDTSSHVAMFNSATGSLAALTDPGLTYNAGTNVLTSTFAGNITGNVTGDVTGDLEGDVTGNSDTATAASTVVVVDSTDASSSIAMFDSATGSLAAKTDAGLTYNASSGMLTATGFTGPLTGNASGSSATCSGLAATATALETARTIGGTSFDGTANIAVALATLATTVTITDNEDTDEDNAVIFTAGGDVDGGNLGLESDGTLTYNPSTGKVTATGFIGALTGNASGSSATCSGLAATATALASARTIGGTSFDGTANIAVALSATATALATARAINGTNFDGTAAITIASAAGTLTGATLASGVTASSLTSVGTLTSVTSSGTAYIGDTANAKSTLGLTINQAANNDEILAFKSSAIAHGITGQTETDTYGYMRKAHATGGGLLITGLTDTNGSPGSALGLTGMLGEPADTDKDTSAQGIVDVRSYVVNGAGTNVVAPAAEGNIVVFATTNTRFIFDQDGTAHADDVWTDSVY